MDYFGTSGCWMYIKVLFLVTFLTTLSSCGSAKINTNESTSNPLDNGDAIVFLVFKMQQNSEGTNSIALISQTQTAGKIKGESEMAIAPENYLTINLFNNNRLYKTIIKEHPLFKHVEYPDENHQLVSKNIELKEDEFFIRLQKNSIPIQVRISETLKNKPKKDLLVLKI